MNAKLSRRKLIKKSAAIAFFGSIFLNNPLQLFGRSLKSGEKSIVVLIRNKAVLGDNGFSKIIMQQMLDEAVINLTGAVNSKEAWAKILNPDDMLGIKSNNWSHLHTPTELEEILTEKALEQGIEKERISVNDRDIRDDEVFKNATALINVRPARTHHWSGLGTLIKNYIMFDPKPSNWHSDSCADLAGIWKKYKVAEKTRLNILVMMTPLFHGVGPHHFNQNYVWQYNGLLVGFDPVAIDATGVRIIQAKRKEFFGEERPINPPPKHVFYAETRHKLGYASAEKIELIKLGDTQDILI